MFYFILLITRKCNVLTLSPRFYSWKGSLPRQILMGGLPSFFLMLMSTVSNLVLNKLVVSFSNRALAGMGVAKRLDGFVFAIHTGMSQGVLSLIAYNFSAGNGKRMKEAIKTAFLYTEAVSVLVAVLLLSVRFRYRDSSSTMRKPSLMEATIYVSSALPVLLLPQQ